MIRKGNEDPMVVRKDGSTSESTRTVQPLAETITARGRNDMHKMCDETITAQGRKLAKIRAIVQGIKNAEPDARDLGLLHDALVRVEGILDDDSPFVQQNAYQRCVACSGSLLAVESRTEGNKADYTVQTCTRCGGIHIVADRFDTVLRFVNIMTMLPGKADLSNTRYFDVTYRSGDTVRRSHGWYAPDDRYARVVQFG